ncbi:MAG: PAS domain-containing sensor histidine kinase [Actinomycetota bacterium]
MIIGVCTVAFDTRRRRLEESTFRALLDAAPDAIVIVGDDERIVLVNQQTELLFGYKREELLGEPIEILVPEQNRGKHRGYRTSYFTAPVPRPMGAGLSLSARRKGGSQFPVEISLSPLQTPEGLLLSAAIRDVTAHRRAEGKFRALLESAPDAMVIVGNDGRIVLVNRQAELLFGYERADLLGQPVEVLVPHRFRRGHGEHRASYFHGPAVRPMGAGLQLYGLRRDDTQFRRDQPEPNQDRGGHVRRRGHSRRHGPEGGRGAAAVRPRTREEAVERQRELDNLKDEFLSIVSHELRTPLSSILGFSEMLTRKKHLIGAEKRTQLLDRIWSNASAMNRMVEQLLDYSRLEVGKVSLRPERQGLRALVEGSAGRLRDLLRAHSVSIDVDPALTADADGQAFERILANLLTNSAKFTPKAERPGWPPKRRTARWSSGSTQAASGFRRRNKGGSSSASISGPGPPEPPAGRG